MLILKMKEFQGCLKRDQIIKKRVINHIEIKLHDSKIPQDIFFMR